jgi:hypothetical protein
MWQLLSKKRKQEEIAKYQARLETSELPPAAASMSVDMSEENVQHLIEELLKNIVTDAPSFPTYKEQPSATHRVKVLEHSLPFSALVARPVGKQEIQREKKAQAALDAEWLKLTSAKVWDEEHPREWSELSSKAKKNGSTIHVGRVFEICVEKGSELPLTAQPPQSQIQGTSSVPRKPGS